jgi:hypothetical protein
MKRSNEAVISAAQNAAPNKTELLRMKGVHDSQLGLSPNLRAGLP